MQEREPGFDAQDGEIGGVIEEGLRPPVVHDERVVDHHEIHVGIAPVDDGVAEQEKRGRKACGDRGKSTAPAEKGETGEGVARAFGGRLAGIGRLVRGHRGEGLAHGCGVVAAAWVRCQCVVGPRGRRQFAVTVIPREGGYPVRRSLSIPSLTSLEYWIVRSSRTMTTENAATWRPEKSDRLPVGRIGRRASFLAS